MGLFGSKKKVEEAGAGGEARLSDGTTVQVARRVDCRGDSCPRPQLMTKKAVSEVAPGGVVEVLVDNPSSVEALPPMCDELNATHLETIKDPACWRVYIKKD
ncbi:MAG: sulfurtransferase TusA family protein [Burkholderiales bacterium]|jgi:tRNA 2-thiouridine synthesizing protein A|nr:sulfurtransferase TusA family protein [Zoogloeaceae bacterium]MBV6410529.1 Sulfurtransferase TusA [Rhodocyclaceae bacterium]MCZ2173113.1 sulfurtransferase TusA family protein [Burkholderiales bacterium]HNQ58067.1 sulfurtransferase TusA family protein [Candidatus Desulfobacillus denitrificans]MCQ3922765.1 sulfurtransferase TusA family protein [Rhodocyclaceae bacterium]